MANLNKVLLIGRLTRDPELRYTPSGAAVADFGLAINRFFKGKDGNRQEETAFVDVAAWGKTGELVSQYLKKGRQAFIEGHLRFEQWTSKEGQKRSKLTVVAESVQFLDSKEAGGGGGPSEPRPQFQPAEYDQSGPPDVPSFGGDDPDPF